MDQMIASRTLDLAAGILLVTFEVLPALRAGAFEFTHSLFHICF